ncbi:tetratricopeptide repeat protein [Tamilnaduibacter salinus]|uniref:Tetratricopeptide repeat protein n=1 Tax=Tamilnaduibacter salinus TaxID=1484056 RepID=A0A2U1D033_9GAMM|nr:tetratricopeptide repeat protein [Tamilnaduibacter salinus]PVY78284.1 tetratricopeptide repeat protein [Tamilnaduibacter salinus]
MIARWPLRYCLAVCLALPMAVTAQSFELTLNEDGKTIADMRPVFLRMEPQPLPDISLKEVIRRYRALFAEADDPEVRIDALHRLNNLYSLSGQDLSLPVEQEVALYREALDSYESIASSGVYHGRLDELLYQTAKAHAFVGRDSESIDRLEQLVGLYPDSGLAPEARFRIAESAFSEGEYQRALRGYQRVLAGDARQELVDKSRYMVGWSQFKLGQSESAGVAFLRVLDDWYARSDGFESLKGGAANLVEDSFRILAIMASRREGVASLEQWMATTGDRHWDVLLYDRLADFHLSRERYSDSARVTRAFIEKKPDHSRTPAMYRQLVRIWESGRFPEEARQARQDYAEAFMPSSAYRSLPADEQSQWRRVTRNVADRLYASAGTGSEVQAGRFRQSARFYDRLADRAPEDSGEWRRLAGDAWYQGGALALAVTAYDKAAYRHPGYREAADAAWAGLKTRREKLIAGQGIAEVAEADQLMSAARRFTRRFPEDTRGPDFQADLSQRLVAAGFPDRALTTATQVTGNGTASIAARRSAHLVMAEHHFADEDWKTAATHYDNALALAGQASEKTNTTTIQDRLATSLHRQAQAERKSGQPGAAVALFERAADVAASGMLTVTARHDAAAAMLAAQQWEQAIGALERFTRRHETHELAGSAREKLVYAYRQSGQPIEAANIMLAGAAESDHPWKERLAAARLLEKGGEVNRALVIYGDYLEATPTARTAEQHVERQTLRHRLLTADDSGSSPYRAALLERELASDWHSQETLAWASQAALFMADEAATTMASITLEPPLQASLEGKRAALETALKRFRQAGRLGDATVQSRALYGRAELYRTLAADIMASPVPAELNDLEQSQYRILLEEQAYPFEEKAIALHERNHGRLANGVHDDWIERSIEALATLFPARYQRDVRWMSWQPAGEDDAS